MRAIGCGLVFLGSLAGAALGMRASLPERPDIPVVSEKLGTVARQEGVDTIFIGTSRVFHQLDPRVFDARMAELGCPTKSYNSGVDGMHFPETFYVLERILQSAPAIKLVILEAGMLQRRDDVLRDHGSLRGLYWRDWSTTNLLVRAAWNDPQPPPGFRERRLAWLGEQLALATKNCAGLGRGAAWLEGWLHETRPPDPKLRADGYMPIERQLTAQEEAEFRRRLAVRPPNATLPRREDPEFREALERLAVQLRARGAEPCFILMPAFRKDLPDIPQGVAGRPILLSDFDDPTRHPELFEPENYYDFVHLNATGSQLLSRKLADAVAQHIAALP